MLLPLQATRGRSGQTPFSRVSALCCAPSKVSERFLLALFWLLGSRSMLSERDPLVRSLLADQEVVFELKDDSEVRGTIEASDPYMNTTLTNAKVMLPDGSASEHDSYSLQGTSIRYVHLPPKIPARSAVTTYVKRLESVRKRNAPGKIVDRKKPRLDGEAPADVIDLGVSHKELF